jgi:hypothetical protein
MAAVTAHLWAGAPLPLEYLQLILCRDVYHCPPAQLPPLRTIMRHVACMDAEAQVRRMRHG